MAGSESARHLELKRLTLGWAQQQGYTIAAAEVSVPRMGRCRLDVAAYRPASAAARRASAALPLGTTAIFECKQSRADFLRDTDCEKEIGERLVKLAERRRTYEGFLRQRYPALRLGEELFPEFDGYRFEAAGYEPYEKLTAEIRTLTARLHHRTKFARLARWQAANLHYVVAEAEVAQPCELPAGWGLLLREGEELLIAEEAVWHPATEQQRWNLLLHIGMSGTRAVRQNLGIARRPAAEKAA